MGKVLIFVTKKVNAEDVANRLRTKDFKPILLHGDMLQMERNEKLQAFRKEANIMVATDVAGKSTFRLARIRLQVKDGKLSTMFQTLKSTSPLVRWRSFFLIKGNKRCYVIFGFQLVVWIFLKSGQ